MAKELPYFQFEPAEYLTGDISFCSLSAQGLFTILCSYYWQRSCKLSKDQFLRRINNPKEFQELVDENVIQLEDFNIKIKFLDEQLSKVTKQSKTNSVNGSKGGRPKKINPKETETKPKLNRNETETKGIREDKIREDKIKEKEKIITINNKFFLENCKKSIQWLETTAMQKQVKLETIILYLEKFDYHLIEHQEQKETLKDYKSHFVYWLNKQNLSNYRKKVIGKTNQV